MSSEDADHFPVCGWATGVTTIGNENLGMVWCGWGMISRYLAAIISLSAGLLKKKDWTNSPTWSKIFEIVYFLLVYGMQHHNYTKNTYT